MMLDTLQMLVAGLELAAAFGIITGFLAFRDRIKQVPELEKQLLNQTNYYNEELRKIRTEIKELDGSTELNLDELDNKMIELEKSIGKENRLFLEILGRLNVTLERLDNSVGHLNTNMKETKELFNNTVDRIYIEFTTHKKEIREDLTDLRRELTK